ncbi:MAG TPA: hypothetical protein VGV15_21305 [Terriglobales bacterium]|nr:hypothetical protein [Terriglobales bacterium]
MPSRKTVTSRTAQIQRVVDNVNRLMSTITLLALTLLAMAIGLAVFRAIPVLHTYFLYRGKRLVTCPETLKTPAVGVAARTAAASAFLGEPTFRLDRCSRWPERQNCGQECLRQIMADPENCLLWNIVSNWYFGQSCVYCRKRFGATASRSCTALMREDRTTIEWDQIRPEELQISQ